MRLVSNLHKRGLLAAALAVCLLSAGAARAQFSPPAASDLLRSNPKVVKVFKSVVAEPSESTVRIKCDGKDTALGAVVATDGWIITKASDLKGKLVCRLKDGREYDAKVVGVKDDYDLALLKIEAAELRPIIWRDSKEAKVGRWVATVSTGDEPAAIGVISVAVRDFKPGDQPLKNATKEGGYLGVGLEDADGGAKINQVAPKAPAEKAGFKVNDIVTHINEKKVLGTESMINMIHKHKPGDEVKIKFLREGKEMELSAKLDKRPAAMLGNPQDFMGSALSNRRGGFPRILQHDTVIKPADCGGPLVDLDSKAVGINIARAGRTESYAIPSEVVRDLIPELMSGRLAPPPEEPEAKTPPKKEEK